MIPAAVHLVFTQYPTRSGKTGNTWGLERHYVGKYWRSATHVAVLEDHAGLLSCLPEDGALTAQGERSLAILASSSYLRVVPKNAMHPAEHRGGPMSRLTRPEDDEAETTNGLTECMAALRALVADGKMSPEALTEIERGIFGDEQIPSLGNRRAYRDHRKAAGTGLGSGVYLEIDFELPYPSDAPQKREFKEELHLAAGGLLVRAIDDVLGGSHLAAWDVAWHVFSTHYVARAPTMESAVLLDGRLRADVEAHPLIAGYRLAVTTRLVDALSAPRSS